MQQPKSYDATTKYFSKIEELSKMNSMYNIQSVILDKS